MKVFFSRFLGFLKYVLLVISFALVFYGIIVTYKRLDKNIMEAIPVFIPFLVVFVVYIVNLFIRSKVIRDNLLYNAVSVIVFAVIIVICIRAKFDTSMILYYKYAIDFNPAYFADNLSTIQMMLYTLAGSNVLFMLSALFDEKKVKKVEINDKKKIKKEEDEN